MAKTKLITVAELPGFAKQAEKLLGKEELGALIDYVAHNPMAGSVIEGTGGIRKLRWARQGMGKSGGVRVIYFYYSDNQPVFLLDIYGKSEKDNLSKAERNELAGLIEILVVQYRRKK